MEVVSCPFCGADVSMADVDKNAGSCPECDALITGSLLFDDLDDDEDLDDEDLFEDDDDDELVDDDDDELVDDDDDELIDDDDDELIDDDDDDDF